MMLNRLSHAISQVSKTVPLQIVLILPFALQTLATVGLVGYFSFRNGQQTVSDLSSQLRRGITNRIEEKLNSYTEVPHTINRFNAIAFAENNIDVDNAEGEYQFWQQTLMFPATSLIYCGSDRSGAVLGAGRLAGENSLQLWESNATTNHIPHFYSLNSQGQRDRLLGKDTKRFDARLRPWYKAALAAGQPTWSEIYADFTTGLPTITASVPVYDATTQALRGVCATDFFLPQEMNQFLASLELGESGTAFIMERSGLLVSTSTEQPTQGNLKTAQRFSATASEHQTVRATATYLQDRFGSFSQIQSSQLLDFQMDSKKQFVQVLPFRDRRGLDWLIVTVLPEADFMRRIQTNTYITVLLCIATLMLGVGLSILIARWITRPLVSLSRSAKALAQGEWDQTVKIERSGDLGELATSFNGMAHQLQASFVELQQAEQRLADYNQMLEAQIAQRTTDLRASEQKFASAFRASPVAMGILALPDGKYIDVNDSFCHTMGYPREQVIGRTCADLNLWKHLADRDRIFQLMAETGSLRAQDVEFRHQSGETLLIRGSGELISLDGAPCILSIYEDVTECRRVEDALRQREQKLRLLTDALPVCIFYVDADWRYRFINQTYEDWLGCHRDQVMGKQMHELLGEVAGRTADALSNRVLEGQIITFEAEIFCAMGEKSISATFVPDFGHSTQLKGYYGLITDISDRKRAETASILEERNRFAREIHDTLAQAFTGVILQMETAKVILPTDSKARTLIDTTHDLAREGLAEARRSVWALRPPQLAQGLSSALQHLVTRMTTGTALQTHCQIQTPPDPLSCDIATNLLRIVQEATTNTLKHANASAIFVELTFDSQVVRLRVQDNGDGFDPNHHGLGFGLVGMRERAQNLGGQLSVTSQPGQGTEIVAVLPLAVPFAVTHKRR